MINPIEVMAKTYWENRGNHSWDSLTETMKRHEMDDIRAALLALSECDLPGDGRDEDREFLFHFRAMLKKLAENSNG